MHKIDRRSFLSGAASSGAAMLALSQIGCAEPRPTAMSPEIAQDMALLRQALAIHPGAERYMSVSEIDAAITQLGSDLTANEALDQRYLIFSRFLSRLKCGHTYANFFNQSPAVRDALFDRQTRLPFAFRWLEEGMVVTQAVPGVDIPAGSIVTDINGVDPNEMLETLLPYTRADGNALGKRRALLEVQNRSRFEYFDIFHGLVYGVPANGAHDIGFVMPSGEARSVRADAISLADRQAIRQAAQAQTDIDEALWQFEVRDNVAILTMPGWSTFNTSWDWQGWLDERLDESVDLDGLIIDNRSNEGGDISVGARLMSRLISEPISVPQSRRLVRFRSFPEALREHAGTWDRSFYAIGENADPVEDGFYQLPVSTAFPTTLQPRGRTVSVPVVLLTSPTNSSAGFMFAKIAKQSGRMRLVGEETGGNRRGTNGDGFFFTTLPHIGIEFDLPMVGHFPETPQPDSGIVPDVTISETAADIANGFDATLARAFEELGR